MDRVIVAGANGFIGKNLVNILIEKGYYVTVLDYYFDSELADIAKCVCVKNKSIEEIRRELQNEEYSCFFDLAWVGTSGPLRADYNIQLDNARITCDYVKLAASISCPRFLYASSINEMETYEYLQSDDAEPTSGYIYGAGKLVAHLMGETVAKAEGIDFIPVIITNIFGIGEKSARLVYTSLNKLISGEHCSFTDGKQMYDFIYITDAINSIIAVAEKGKPFNRYYLGSGEPKPLREFLLAMKNIVAPQAEIGLGDISFKGIDIDYTQFNLHKVQNDTGYINQVSFEKGIKMTSEWIKGLL